MKIKGIYDFSCSGSFYILVTTANKYQCLKSLMSYVKLLWLPYPDTSHKRYAIRIVYATLTEKYCSFPQKKDNVYALML